MEKTPVVRGVEGLLRKEGMYGLTFSEIAQHARGSSPFHLAPRLYQVNLLSLQPPP